MPNLKLHHNILEDCQEILSNTLYQKFGIVTVYCKDGFVKVDKLLLALTSSFWKTLLDFPTNENIILIAPEYAQDFFQSYIKLCTFGTVEYDQTKKDQGFEKFARDSKDNIKDQFNVDKSEDITCPICIRTFETVQSCKRHIQTMHKDKKKYICPSCGMEYNTKEGLKSHTINTHQNTDPHICPQLNCGTVFQNRSSLLRHCQLKKHKFPKSLKNKKLQTHNTCDICFKDIGLRGNMLAHKEKYHQTQNFECDHCEYKTTRKDALTRHQYTKHKLTNKGIDAIKEFFTEDGVSFQCQECKKTFDSKNAVTQHLLQQSCEEQKCEICGKVFKLKQHLKQHLKNIHKKQL